MGEKAGGVFSRDICLSCITVDSPVSDRHRKKAIGLQLHGASLVPVYLSLPLHGPLQFSGSGLLLVFFPVNCAMFRSAQVGVPFISHKEESQGWADHSLNWAGYHVAIWGPLVDKAGERTIGWLGEEARLIIGDRVPTSPITLGFDGCHATKNASRQAGRHIRLVVACGRVLIRLLPPIRAS